VVLPFAAVAVFVVPLATDTLVTDLGSLAFPVYWLVSLLFGMQVSLRQTGTETRMQRRQLAMAGVDPLARFVGRVAAAGALIFSVTLFTLPLVVLFYNPRPLPPLIATIGTILLFAAGLSILSTLAGDVTVGLRTRSALAPLIVAPLAVPLIIGASRAVESLTRGSGSLTWTGLLVIVDLALGAVAVLAARPMEDATI
jgi:heme exporter protein B